MKSLENIKATSIISFNDFGEIQVYDINEVVGEFGLDLKIEGVVGPGPVVK
jgi:hypothetical protein